MLAGGQHLPFPTPLYVSPFAFCILTFPEKPILPWCKAQGGKKPKEEDGEDFGPGNTYKRSEGEESTADGQMHSSH